MAYTTSDYGKMINDKWRMGAYVSALNNSIKKDSIVVDLGAGTGIFSLLACKLGAKKVYAIEPNPALNLGVKSAKKNGYEDKITFINKSSTDVTLPEKADILISDIRGMLPLYGNNLEVIMDARDRFLKKSGVLIPGKDQIICSVAGAQGLYRDITKIWEKGVSGLDLSDGRAICVNGIYPLCKNRINILTESKKWLEIDYYKLKKNSFKQKLSLKSLKTGIAHGIVLWFNSNLTKDTRLLNSPDVKGSKVYGRGFFPFSRPVKLTPGNRIEIEISASLNIDSYIWSWKTKVFKKYSKVPFAEFKQSTFLNKLISPNEFIKKAPGYKTSLNSRGLRELDILNMFKKRSSNEKIAAMLIKKYPGNFKNIDEALQYVGLLSLKYGN